jgi:hypothetical protein
MGAAEEVAEAVAEAEEVVEAAAEAATEAATEEAAAAAVWSKESKMFQPCRVVDMMSTNLPAVRGGLG